MELIRDIKLAGTINSVAFARDGRYVALAGHPNNVRVLAADDFDIVHTLDGVLDQRRRLPEKGANSKPPSTDRPIRSCRGSRVLWRAWRTSLKGTSSFLRPSGCRYDWSFQVSNRRCTASCQSRGRIRFDLSSTIIRPIRCSCDHCETLLGRTGPCRCRMMVSLSVGERSPAGNTLGRSNVP